MIKRQPTEILLSFDSDKFIAAYNANPLAVQALFTQGGVATNSAVSAIGINDRTAQHTAATPRTGTPEASGLLTLSRWRASLSRSAPR